MLDTATKKRIDDCRDILVGKLPDPKAQIEQITIGLIYKFMDDMDKEAIDLGGKAKFFADYFIPDPENPKKKKIVPFSQYSWDNLFNTKVTAAEMLRLYSEAIAGMDKNPNIPQLFRDIFKNAFLPYRDPETLKLFLKTIGEFEYTHSEKLGDAFEYLLSVMGSQGDAGQFRTPRHIIDFLVAVVNPGKKDTILDPACGTAGFLISAFKHITAQNKKGLTPDERKKLIQNFTGYDISPDMVRLSLVNLYLHGFNDPHIWEYDTLSSEERWDETADVILANPPFMSPKGGIRPHKKFSISSNRSEVLFVDYIAEHLNPKGRAGIIVPEGVIFQSGTAYKDLRKMLVENYLYAVVSLPAGVFNPYSGVKTSILLMDRESAKTNNEILFVKIENDGYGLGAQRTPVKGSQLEEAIELIQQFKEGSFTESEIAHTVAKNEIARNGDYNLSGERYRKVILSSSDYEFIPCGELIRADVKSFDPSTKPDDKYELWSIPAFDMGFPEILYGREIGSSKKIVIPRDVLLSRIIPHIRRGWVVENNNSDFLKIASTEWIVFNSEKVVPKYLQRILTSDIFHSQFMLTITGVGGSLSRANPKAVGEIKIPLPPLSIQEEIVAEIEGYQKIIDGAKAVVENYKPKIDINPDWEMVELGEAAEIIMGQSPSGESYNLEGVGIPLINGPVEFGPEPFSKTIKRQYTTEATKMCKEGDLILCVRGSTTGRMNIAGFDGCIGRGVAAIRSKENQGWINQYINSIREKLYSLGSGSTFPNITSVTLKELKIPIPPIEIQHQIVSQIEKEQSLVNANKQLIEIFEQKIKDRIAKVWGADKAAPVLYGENDELTMAAEG